MYVLTITLGEYDWSNTRVLAVSQDRSKLELRIQEHLERRRLINDLTSKFDAEIEQLVTDYPFQTEPPELPEKPIVTPRTRDEHEARRQVKEQWREKNDIFLLMQQVYRDAIRAIALHRIHERWPESRNVKLREGHQDDPQPDQYEITEVEEIT